MAIGQHNKRAVGIFPTRQEAEYALSELRNSGFSMNQVSIIAQNAGDHGDIAGIDVGTGNQAGEAATAGAVTGGLVGGLIGLIGALSALTVPGIGPIVAGGAIASVLGDALIGGAVGAATGGLVGALMGLGIPEERARVYNSRISQGGYLVMVDGTDEEISRAEVILSTRGIQEWGIYDTPEVAATGTGYAAPYEPPIDPAYAAYPSPTPLTSGFDPLGVSYPLTQPTGFDTGDAYLERQKRAVGIFSSRREAEDALHELRDSGFPMGRVSVIAKNADQLDSVAGVDVNDHVRDNQADEGARTGAVAGGALGGLTGLLVGLGALAIPGIGPVMLAGATATAIATTLSGGAIGALAGSLLGALVGLGIPEEQARVYNDRVSRGDYLVMVDGTEEEIDRAEQILGSRGIQEWGIYDAPAPADVDTSRIDATDRPVERRENTTQVNDQVTIVDRREQVL